MWARSRYYNFVIDRNPVITGKQYTVKMPIAFRRFLKLAVIIRSCCSRKYHTTRIVRQEKNIENVADLMIDDNSEIDRKKEDKPRRWKVKKWLQEQEQRLETPVLRGPNYLASTHVKYITFKSLIIHCVRLKVYICNHVLFPSVSLRLR